MSDITFKESIFPLFYLWQALPGGVQVDEIIEILRRARICGLLFFHFDVFTLSC